MLPAILRINKYMWLIIYYFFKNCIILYISIAYLRTQRTSKQWLAYQEWYAYHSFRNNATELSKKKPAWPHIS